MHWHKKTQERADMTHVIQVWSVQSWGRKSGRKLGQNKVQDHASPSDISAKCSEGLQTHNNLTGTARTSLDTCCEMYSDLDMRGHTLECIIAQRKKRGLAYHRRAGWLRHYEACVCQ